MEQMMERPRELSHCLDPPTVPNGMSSPEKDRQPLVVFNWFWGMGFPFSSTQNWTLAAPPLPPAVPRHHLQWFKEIKVGPTLGWVPISSAAPGRQTEQTGVEGERLATMMQAAVSCLDRFPS